MRNIILTSKLFFFIFICQTNVFASDIPNIPTQHNVFDHNPSARIRAAFLSELDQQALDIGTEIKTQIRLQAFSQEEAVQYLKNSGLTPITELFMQEPTSFKALKIYEIHRDNQTQFDMDMMRGVFFVLFNIEHGHHPLSGLAEEAKPFLQYLLATEFNIFNLFNANGPAGAA